MSKPASSLPTEDLASDIPTSQFLFGTNNAQETKSFDFTTPNPTVLSPARIVALRRSPRLSGTPNPGSSGAYSPLLDAVKDAEVSRPGTPDNDYVQDEPSSILATKIMRAQDNPSPPPKSPVLSSSFRFPGQPFPFAESDSPDQVYIGDLPSTPSHLPVSRTTFSSPSSPAARTQRGISPACLPLPSSPNPSPVIIGEKSPHQPSLVSPNDIVHRNPESGPPNQATFSDCLEEEAVAKELTTSVDENEPDPTVDNEIKHHESEGLVQTEQSDSLLKIATETGEQFPASSPRRSSRPRRSNAAYAMLPQEIPLPSSQPALPMQGTEHMSGFPDTVSIVREKSPRRKTTVSSERELGSLSPASVTVLDHLLPSPLSPLKEKEESQTPSTSHVVAGQISGTIHEAPPIRFSSPRRPTSLQKVRLQPVDLDDPDRTPAKRVPISPTKVANNFFAPGPSKTNIFKIPSTDSPARRIVPFGTESFDLSPSKGKLPGSPIRFTSQRSKSVESQSPARPLLSISKKRSGSVEPISVKGKEPVRFARMFPNERSSQPSSQNTLSKSIPEEIEPPEAHVNKPLTSLPKPSSSHLKQTTSRIPRMKPYSRPQSNLSKAVEKTSRIAARGVTSGLNGSKVDQTRAPTMLRPHVGPSAAISKSRTALPSPSPNLKRKREPDSTPLKSSSVKSSSTELSTPTKLSPVVVVPSLKTVLSRSMAQPSLETEPLPIEIHPVVDESQSHPQPESLPVAMDVAPSTAANAMPSVSPSMSEPSDTQNRHDEPNPPNPSESTLRRTTRTRKPAQSVAQLPPPSRRTERPPPRRRPPMVQDTGPFSNMSAVALRALTNSNTTKNQRYLTANLETEIIRKEGPRPASPVMKVKTISEKEKEEKERDRNARAERRARRSQDDSSALVVPTTTSTQSDTDDDDDDWVHPTLSPTPRQRIRTSGEDEDHETSDRSPRPTKRMRLFDEGEEKKRVKWDQGLFTEMYLDDIKPRQRARSNTPDVMKGCLAPTAKALILDTLGNLPNAESPLKDLIKENVVVKKFVYDTDVEEVTPVPIETPKHTRSKSRKSKS